MKTFKVEKPFDEKRATRYLERWAVKYNFAQCRTPTSQSNQNFLRRVRHTATSPDGIPYSAWENTHGQGAATLFLLGDEISCGYQPALTFNPSMTLFPPKGDDEFDSEDITREATATRPLSLKNCDNKTKVE